jgi:NAD(P)-dependent dehydrogenase (short-subunit alcohol dehydrogenase family)
LGRAAGKIDFDQAGIAHVGVIQGKHYLTDATAPVQMYVKWQAKERKTTEDAVKAEITKKFPIGEIPADEDVAEVAVLFCSDRTRMVTGQFLRVDGGEKMG